MNDFGITERSYEFIMEAILSYAEIEEAFIFGSRAKGNYRKGSDIDIAIKGKRCSESTALNLSAHLNEELPIPYFIDVVFYDGLDNSSLKEHIDGVGKLMYSTANFIWATA